MSVETAASDPISVEILAAKPISVETLAQEQISTDTSPEPPLSAESMSVETSTAQQSSNIIIELTPDCQTHVNQDAIRVTIHHTTQQQKDLNVTAEPPQISVVQREDLIDSTSTTIRGRKRVRNVKNWKRNLKNIRRNSGSENIGRAGKINSAKVVQPAEHACRYKCCKM